MDKLKAKPVTCIADQCAINLADDILSPDREKPSRIAVAISGGADSFALLHMVTAWAQHHNIETVALTVDHKLRNDSTAEAQHVAAWCKANSITHHILDWDGEKPRSAIQDKARIMRRKLLTGFCAQNNIRFLLLGHQADDQAETFFMRLQRGSGVTGLSSMQQDNYDTANGVHVLRPLLFARRSELRDYCTQNALPFIDDPSNDNTDYERVRIRQALQDFPDMTQGIIRATLRLQRADDTLHNIATQWLDNSLQQIDDAILWLPRDIFLAQPHDIRLRILMQLVTRLTGNINPSLSDIEDWELCMRRDDFSGMNIAGCWARPKIINKTQGFAFQPEPVRKHI